MIHRVPEPGAKKTECGQLVKRGWWAGSLEWLKTTLVWRDVTCKTCIRSLRKNSRRSDWCSFKIKPGA